MPQVSRCSNRGPQHRPQLSPKLRKLGGSNPSFGLLGWRYLGLVRARGPRRAAFARWESKDWDPQSSFVIPTIPLSGRGRICSAALRVTLHYQHPPNFQPPLQSVILGEDAANDPRPSRKICSWYFYAQSMEFTSIGFAIVECAGIYPNSSSMASISERACWLPVRWAEAMPLWSIWRASSIRSLRMSVWAAI